jgi:hypothetical protein
MSRVRIPVVAYKIIGGKRMSKNPFDLKFKPLKFKEIGTSSKSSKRVLGIRDKQILYRLAKGRCEACGKKIQFDEMQSGHKNAASKGGSATLKNSVCLCYRCNKEQGTDSWATYMKKTKRLNTPTVTSVKRKTVKKKKKSSNDNYIINPFTGKKEKIKPLFNPKLKW